jgi:hypothetical protein
MRDQEPAPWLLLCRDSDLLNTDGYADRPTSYDKAYIDLMQAYRNAARMIMSVADSMWHYKQRWTHPDATALTWRIALKLEAALWIYRGADTDPQRLVDLMAREFRRLRRRFDVIHRHDEKEASECRMANMLVAEVLRDYKLPMTARGLIEAYYPTPWQTTEPPGAKHARWYLLRKVKQSAAHMRGMQRYLTARALSTSRPPHGARNSVGVGGVVGQPTRDTNYAAMPMNFEMTKETTERHEGDWLPGSRLAATSPSFARLQTMHRLREQCSALVGGREPAFREVHSYFKDATLHNEDIGGGRWESVVAYVRQRLSPPISADDASAAAGDTHSASVGSISSSIHSEIGDDASALLDEQASCLIGYIHKLIAIEQLVDAESNML